MGLLKVKSSVKCYITDDKINFYIFIGNASASWKHRPDR